MKNRIRELRKARKLTMKELGAIIGLAESTISQYENGKREPDFETLLKLGEFFGVSVDFILGRDADDNYSKIFRSRLLDELSVIDPEDFVGVNETETDYDFLVNLSGSSHPISLAEACQAADYLGTSLDDMLDWSSENKKALDTAEAMPRADRDYEIMRLVRTLSDPQKDFLIAYLETLVARNQAESPAAPAPVSGTAPISGSLDQT